MASSPSQVSIRQVEPDNVSDAEPRADDALLKLFWNRAELKKEFARLRDERATLQDRIRHQEGQILRAQQRLEYLEGQLADPARAVQAALFYQLRALWTYGHRRIARLVREQAQRELQDEQCAQITALESRRRAELADIDARMAQANARLRQARFDRELALRRFGGWRGWFMRRQARQVIAVSDQALADAMAELQRVEALRELRVREPAASAASQLSIAGRRRVNLAALAMAQELAIHFAAGRIAIRARDASARQLRDVDFGSSADCRKLSRLAARRLQELESQALLAQRVEKRAAYLARVAKYRSDQDVVPVSRSISDLPLQPGERRDDGASERAQLDVIADDFWDLSSVLLP